MSSMAKGVIGGSRSLLFSAAATVRTFSSAIVNSPYLLTSDTRSAIERTARH